VNNNNSIIRLGVVGVGSMGQNHARLYSQPITQNSKLVGVADADSTRAKEIGEKYGVPYYSDYHDLMGKVDAVSIAVPTTLHYKVAMEFLKAGIHCLVEKPIAYTINEAEEMIEAAANNHVNLAVGHIERFNPSVIKLKEVIDKGTLGQILIISTRRVGPYAPRIRDVGVIIDSATHDIGVVNYLVGKIPVAIHAKWGKIIHSKEDHAILLLDYGETSASIEVNWFTPHKVRTLVATGSEGIAYLDYIEQTLVIHNTHSETPKQINQNPKLEPLKTELEDFLDSIAKKRNSGVSGKEALEILRIALEASNL